MGLSTLAAAFTQACKAAARLPGCAATNRAHVSMAASTAASAGSTRVESAQNARSASIARRAPVPGLSALCTARRRPAATVGDSPSTCVPYAAALTTRAAAACARKPGPAGRRCMRSVWILARLHRCWRVCWHLRPQHVSMPRSRTPLTTGIPVSAKTAMASKRPADVETTTPLLRRFSCMLHWCRPRTKLAHPACAAWTAGPALPRAQTTKSST